MAPHTPRAAASPSAMRADKALSPPVCSGCQGALSPEDRLLAAVFGTDPTCQLCYQNKRGESYVTQFGDRSHKA